MHNSHLKDSFIGKDFTDLETLDFNDPMRKAFQAVYNKGIKDWDLLSQTPWSVSREMIDSIKGKFAINRPKVVEHQQSIDGTQKWLLAFHDGAEVETVFIPHDGDRGVLCISSQVGCVLNCSFCYTGTQKCVRNLTAEEIVLQYMHAIDSFNDWENNQNRKVANIVMMGMGEPLLNYNNVSNALKLIINPIGISLGRRHITVSTSGIVPFIEKCGSELGVLLAISLHATTNHVRDKLVPINKKYPIEELLEACRNYPTARNSRRITFEYVMLKDINDRDEDALRLIKLLKGIYARVNLIPFNPWKGSFYECSSTLKIKRFLNILRDGGMPSAVRETRGQDIMAACGQLKSNSEKKPAYEK